MTLKEAAKLVALAAAAHPTMQDRDLEPTARAWHAILGHLPYDVVQAALLKVLATSKYWPTPAEILETVQTLRVDGPPDPESAWAEVMKQLRKAGYYGTPKWSHPLIGRAVEALYGNWRSFCENSTVETMPTDRAHFMRIYATLVQRQAELDLLPPAVREVAQQLGTRMAANSLPGGGGGKVVPLPRREKEDDR